MILLSSSQERLKWHQQSNLTDTEALFTYFLFFRYLQMVQKCFLAECYQWWLPVNECVWDHPWWYLTACVETWLVLDVPTRWKLQECSSQGQRWWLIHMAYRQAFNRHPQDQEVENAASVAETITMHLPTERSVSRVWRSDCITRLGNKITKALHSNVHVC